MRYLIDGYNLMHALGLLRGNVGTARLQKARQSLLGLLHRCFDDKAASVTVVFDARNCPPGASSESDYLGLHVRFAVHEHDADELIESLIRMETAPGRLTVVSSDRRLQHAARRRRCIAKGCNAFMDELARLREERRETSPEPAEPAKPDAAERGYWREVFADLENEPALREL